MQDFDKSVLRTDMQPSVGEMLLAVTYARQPGSGLPSGQAMGSEVRLQLALLLEIQGLRQDLTNRTLAGRTRRAWGWTFRRLRTAWAWTRATYTKMESRLVR